MFVVNEDAQRRAAEAKERAIKNRYDIFFLSCAQNCNPNGDPDLNNAVRQDYMTGHGYITDVAQKANVRFAMDAMHGGEEGMEIFIRNGDNLNRKIAEVASDVSNGAIKKDGPHTIAASYRACERFLDVRAFGGVLSTGVNAGQIQGPVQFSFATSVAPIDVNNDTITRMAYAAGDYTELSKYDEEAAKRPDSKKRTMGTKNFTPHALYRGQIAVSAHLAERTGFSEYDLDVLLDALCRMYEIRPSASKMGMSVVTPVIVFKHVGTSGEDNPQTEAEAKFGCASAQDLGKCFSVELHEGVEYPRSLSDYRITFTIPGDREVFGKTVKGFPGVQYGFKMPGMPIEYHDMYVPGGKTIVISE